LFCFIASNQTNVLGDAMQSKFQRAMQVLSVIGAAAMAWKVTGAPWDFF
jgi:hypothetical protein